MIEAINLHDRQALLTTGEVIPITELFDDEGDETDDPDEAVAFVAGRPGLWINALVDDYVATFH